MLYQLYHWPTTTIINTLYSVNKQILRLRKTPVILLACFPRSASNHLAYLISESVHYSQNHVKAASGFFHDVMYLPRLIDLMLKKTIITQHLRLTSLTRSIITDLKIRPLILVRNIFDVVVSYNDYISDKGYGPLDPDHDELSPEYCKDYSSFDDSKKIDYLITNIIPWYITFYVSWYHYTFNTNRIDAFWIKYEDLIADPQQKLKDIFAFYKLSIPDSQIVHVLTQNKKINYNKGIAGRGDRLSLQQKENIKKQTLFYPDINFDMIGL